MPNRLTIPASPRLATDVAFAFNSAALFAGSLSRMAAIRLSDCAHTVVPSADKNIRVKSIFLLDQVMLNGPGCARGGKIKRLGALSRR